MKTPEGRVWRKVIWFLPSSVHLRIIQPLCSAIEHRKRGQHRKQNRTESTGKRTTAADATSRAEDSTRGKQDFPGAHMPDAEPGANDPELDLGNHHDPLGFADDDVALVANNNAARDSTALLSCDAVESPLRLEGDEEAKEEMMVDD